jgi:hypothetical protein
MPASAPFRWDEFGVNGAIPAVTLCAAFDYTDARAYSLAPARPEFPGGFIQSAYLANPKISLGTLLALPYWHAMGSRPTPPPIKTICCCEYAVGNSGKV